MMAQAIRNGIHPVLLALLLLAGCNATQEMVRLAMEVPCVRVVGERRERDEAEGKTTIHYGFASGFPLADCVVTVAHGGNWDQIYVEGQSVPTLQVSPWNAEFDDWRKLRKPPGLSQKVETYDERPAPGTPAWIVGFPHETAPKSALADTRRKFVVPARVVNIQAGPENAILLETDYEGDLRGMSGGPVCIYHEGRMAVCGLYVGTGYAVVEYGILGRKWTVRRSGILVRRLPLGG